MKKTLLVILNITLLFGLSVFADESLSNLMEQGQQAMNTGDFASAEASFNAVLKVEPAQADAIYLLGMLKFMQQDVAAALDFFTQGRDAHPEQARFHSMRGHCLNMLGQGKPMNEGMVMFMEGLNEYRTAVRLDDNDLEGHYGLVQYYAHAPTMAGGSMPLAEEHASRVIEINPARGNGLMAVVKQLQGLNEEAIDYANKAIAIDPNNGEAQSVLAVLQHEQ